MSLQQHLTSKAGLQVTGQSPQLAVGHNCVIHHSDAGRRKDESDHCLKQPLQKLGNLPCTWPGKSVTPVCKTRNAYLARCTPDWCNMQVVPEGLPVYSVVEQPDSDWLGRVSSDSIAHALYLSLICPRPLQESAVTPYHCIPAQIKSASAP